MAKEKRPRLRTLQPRVRVLGAGPGGHGWQPDSERGTAAQRGYGYAWQKLRAKILKRDEGLCQECRRNDRVSAATQVDHIRPKAYGGSDDPANLEAICKPCHLTKTSRESR